MLWGASGGRGYKRRLIRIRLPQASHTSAHSTQITVGGKTVLNPRWLSVECGTSCLRDQLTVADHWSYIHLLRIVFTKYKV